MNNSVALDEQYFVAPQIAIDDLSALKALGFERIINNRPDGEVPDQPSSVDMNAAAQALGLEYIDNPINLNALGLEQVEIQRAAIAEPKKTFAFCRTGTRSSVLWVLVNNAKGQSYQSLVEHVSSKGFDLARCEPAMTPLAK